MFDHFHLIPVVFRSEMSVANNENSYSPSAGKPLLVVEDWRDLGMPINVVKFQPVSRHTIALAHDRDYVDAVLDCELPNGFGNCLPQVAASLPFTVGSIFEGARLAIAMKCVDPGRAVACSPTSGFHHAHYGRASGFCTFNGLVVAAMELKRRGLVKRVGILDCDHHYGDGTAALIKHHGLSWLDHWTAGAHIERGMSSSDALASIPSVDRFAKCDVLLYQAGADMHRNDPLGGTLTTEDMAERDRRVFVAARRCKIPVVWNLAGGYQVDDEGSIEPVLALHRNTMLACVAAYGAGHRTVVGRTKH